MLPRADWTIGHARLWDSGDKVYRNVIQCVVSKVYFVLRPEVVLFLPTE